MKLLWILLLVVLLCAQVQTVTELRVKLGQDVILKCSEEDSHTYWLVEMYKGLKVLISGSCTDSCVRNQYFTLSSDPKYSARGSSLQITNVTDGDCRLYFCVRQTTDNPFDFIGTFRLVPDVPLTPSYVSEEIPPLVTMFQNKFLIYGSLALNVSLLLLVGLVSLLVCLKIKKMKNCDCQLIDPSPGSSSNPETLDSQQYAEIQLPQLPPPPPSSQCIYSKAQLPLPPGR